MCCVPNVLPEMCGGEMWRGHGKVGNVEFMCGGDVWSQCVEDMSGRGCVEFMCGGDVWSQCVEDMCGVEVVHGECKSMWRSWG